jgi:hypothetical protein
MYVYILLCYVIIYYIIILLNIKLNVLEAECEGVYWLSTKFSGRFLEGNERGTIT